MSGFTDAIRRAYSAQPHLFIVLASGIFGGILAASVQALFRTKGYLEAFAIPQLTLGQYTLFGIFGALAAGFSVYMAANSRREDLLHLCFFSLSCGIAFPAILLETQTKVAKDAQQQVAQAKNIIQGSQPIADVASVAAAAVTTTVTQAPASEVDPQTQAIITNDTSKIIQQLDNANTPVAAAAAQEIFDAARQAGYVDVQKLSPPRAPAEAPPGN